VVLPEAVFYIPSWKRRNNSIKEGKGTTEQDRSSRSVFPDPLNFRGGLGGTEGRASPTRFPGTGEGTSSSTGNLRNILENIHWGDEYAPDLINGRRQKSKKRPFH